jgi:predicted O-linked N-acetylglucosamine transferase (SPINDLY family)
MGGVSAGSIGSLLKTANAKEGAGHTFEANQILSELADQFPARADVQDAYLQFLSRCGRHSERVTRARSLVESQPAQVFAWLQLASALLAAGQDAMAACEHAARLAKDSADAHELLGIARRRAGQLNEAVASLRRALKLKPSSLGIRVNLANALKDCGGEREAADLYRAVLRMQPGFTLARFNLGSLLLTGGELDEAATLLRKCLQEMPHSAQVHAALGMLARQRNDLEGAIASLGKAVELDGSLAEARFNLASALSDFGDGDKAAAHLDAAIARQPLNARMRTSRIVLELPMVARDRDEAASAPGRFDAGLADHARWQESVGPDKVKDETVSSLPFLLAYREGNHVDSLSRFGDTVRPGLKAPAIARHARAKLRLGIVSRHVRRHSVWDVNVRGIVACLDREKFEIAIYHLGHVEDEQTAYARGHSDLWRDARTVHGTAEAWMQAIVADAPDVLLYPEIGMDPLTYALASLRLAPMQMATWGHPITTGLATIDRFLSAELLEPPDGESHYRETLVRLPGAGCYVEPLELGSTAPGAEVERLAARPGPLLLAPQMPFKFAPDDDDLLLDIARRLGPCSIVLARDSKVGHATELLAKRLATTFREGGLDPDQFLVVAPWLPQAQFQHLLDRAALVLDCPAFSGFTTAWMSLQRGASVLTIEGPSLRQRLASGLLRRVGIDDTLAPDRDGYADLAVRLATEPPADRAARRVATAAAARTADRDASVIEALQALLLH